MGDPSMALQNAMTTMIRQGHKVREWASFVVYGLAKTLSDVLLPPQAASSLAAEESPAAALREHLRELFEVLLPTPAQRDPALAAALAWCREESIEDIGGLKAAGRVHEFVDALNLKRLKAMQLKNLVNDWHG